MKKYFYQKTIAPLLAFLKQGMTAEKVALTLALGISIGIMPMFGITLLLAILAVTFRLNMIAIQAVHYAVSVVQIILFVPFLKLGQYVFNAPELPFSLNNIIELLKTQFLDTFLSMWQIYLMGIFVWLLFAIPLALAVYHLSLPFFIRYKKKLDLEVKMG